MGVPSDAVIVVGGGLSGLVAAVQLGRLDARVVLFDDADEIGGRARTQRRRGFYLNFGPHRLYERGAAVAGLRQLGVRFDAAPRGPNGGFAIWRGTKHTLPVGYCSLLTTDLFGLTVKLEAARFLAGIPALRVSALHDVALGEWLGTQVHDPLPGPSDAAGDEAQLERTLDLLQPGWRDLVVYRRFLPRVVVSHTLVTADRGGIAGRPDGRVQDLDNVFLAGDWIGPTGQLADASVSSGIRAAHAVQRWFTAA